MEREEFNNLMLGAIDVLLQCQRIDKQREEVAEKVSQSFKTIMDYYEKLDGQKDKGIREAFESLIESEEINNSNLRARIVSLDNQRLAVDKVTHELNRAIKEITPEDLKKMVIGAPSKEQQPEAVADTKGLNIELSDKLPDGTYKMVVNGKDYDGVIHNHTIAKILEEKGVTPSQISDLSIVGGNYENECFAGRVWSQQFQERGSVNDKDLSPEKEKEFSRAFSSLRNVSISEKEKIDSHLFTYGAFDKVVTDGNLKEIAGETFAFSDVKTLVTPNAEFNVDEIASPHGMIKEVIGKQKDNAQQSEALNNNENKQPDAQPSSEEASSEKEKTTKSKISVFKDKDYYLRKADRMDRFMEVRGNAKLTNYNSLNSATDYKFDRSNDTPRKGARNAAQDVLLINEASKRIREAAENGDFDLADEITVERARGLRNVGRKIKQMENEVGPQEAEKISADSGVKPRQNLSGVGGKN